MLKDKNTGVQIPTHPDEVSYAFVSLWKEAKMKEAAALITELPDGYLPAFLEQVKDLVNECAMLGAGSSRTALIGNNVYCLPDDILECTIGQFSMYDQNKGDELRQMAVFLIDSRFLNDATLDKMHAQLLASPYYLVKPLMGFFLTYSNQLSQYSKAFQRSGLVVTKSRQDLGQYLISSDGIIRLAKWQADSLTWLLN
jgi:hypothetical protein